MNLLVPKLDHAIVQGGENPRANRMKAQPLHSIRLRLELGQHV
jgi:hypothetical protein